MAEMGWSWAEYLAAPCDLVDEIEERLAGRAKAEKEQQRKSEAAGKRGR
jgi:hypothetical protein